MPWPTVTYARAQGRRLPGGIPMAFCRGGSAAGQIPEPGQALSASVARGRLAVPVPAGVTGWRGDRTPAVPPGVCRAGGVTYQPPCRHIHALAGPPITGIAYHSRAHHRQTSGRGTTPSGGSQSRPASLPGGTVQPPGDGTRPAGATGRPGTIGPGRRHSGGRCRRSRTRHQGTAMTSVDHLPRRLSSSS